MGNVKSIFLVCYNGGLTPDCGAYYRTKAIADTACPHEDARVVEYTPVERCPKCHEPMVRRQEKFFWRGRFFSGLVCVPCNSLWDDPDDSFEEHVGLKCAVWQRDEPGDPK
jgi:hypothetical protein